MNAINKSRIKKELEMFVDSPPSGIFCNATDDDQLDSLTAKIVGATSTPFEGGIFKLEIQIPDRYPFEPPGIRFVTPIYHPNIDKSGRICMDTLKTPPKGTWKPCLNLYTVLMMIRVLMGQPGSEDPLMTDIWQEYKYDNKTYTEKAKRWTQLYATFHNAITEKSEILKEMAEKKTSINVCQSPQECPNSTTTRDVCQISTKQNAMKLSNTENQENLHVTDVAIKKRKLKLQKKT